jgi:hypothetical protein
MKTLLLFIGLIILVASCKKNTFTNSSDAIVALSVDTIHFDTLFTSTGSVTHFFKVFNNNDQKLKLSEITLAGGSSSFFKINADGSQGPTAQNLEIDPNDSIYVFVTVQIDPTASDLPFVVQDSVKVAYNGNTRYVQLQAWGQNATFYREKVIVADTTWTNEKPFVILGGMLIAQGARLNIEEGTEIYLHADAPIIVDGSLNATGRKYDSTKIVFRGDRLDEFYRDLPASWPGIYFRETSSDNVLKHVIVKNAYQGIVADKPSSGVTPKVQLEECVIDNCYDAGIIGINSSITAFNCVISNCGKNVQLVQGGDYEFTHCTNVSINNNFIGHRQPVLSLADFVKIGDVVSFGNLKATFVNCIFWGANGTVENEVVTVREGDLLFDVSFQNCLWKIEEEPEHVTAENVIKSEDPLFHTIDTRGNVYNFRLKEGSPAINTGRVTVISTDLDGNNRTNIPDIGAYETTF